MSLILGADTFSFENAKTLSQHFITSDEANSIWQTTFSGKNEVENINVEELETIHPPYFEYFKASHLMFLTGVFTFNEFKTFINKFFQEDVSSVGIDELLLKKTKNTRRVKKEEKDNIFQYVKSCCDKADDYYMGIASKTISDNYKNVKKNIDNIFSSSLNNIQYFFINGRNDRTEVNIQVSDIPNKNLVHIKTLLFLRELEKFGIPGGQTEDTMGIMMHVFSEQFQYFRDFDIDNAKNFARSNMAELLEHARVDDPELLSFIHSFETGRNEYEERPDIESSQIFSDADIAEALFLGTESGTPFYYKGEGGLITIAPPGSGKTQCHVLPNLMRYASAAIVLDIKGECLETTGDWRKNNVGPVKVFRPDKPELSDRYNPFSLVSQDIDKVWEDSRLLAEMLVIPRSQTDPTWELQGTKLLTLLIAYTAYREDSARNMTTVLDLLSGFGLDEAFEDVLADEAPFPSSMRRTAKQFQQIKNTTEKQFQGILSGASQHLAVWEGSAVERCTSISDWHPQEFRSSRPLTLYLCISPSQIETYAPLLRVLIGQHVRYFLQQEPDREVTPILFMLDELPRLGAMEPIRQALETGRSYKLKLWMFIQYVGQLRATYGKDISDGMIASCGVRSYMNIGADLADELSKVIGETDATSTTPSQPLVKAQELMQLGWRDDILVLGTGEKPLRLEKSFFHQNF